MVGYEKFEIADIKAGEWKKVTLTVTANAPYIIFETDAGKSLFFDTAQVVPLGKTGELGIIIEDNSDISDFEPRPEKTDEKSSPMVIIWCVLAVILLAAVATVVIFAIKKSRKKNI
jgi:uncharacterized membrane protein